MTTETAVILAAGVGSRLRPLTDDRPKALIELDGETIFGRAARVLVEHGVRRLVIVGGYRADMLEHAARSIAAEIVFCHNPDYASTQNSVSLALTDRAVSGSFYKLDADVVFDGEVLARLDACDAELAVAVDAGRHLDAEAMKVRISPDRWIVEFGKAIPIERSAGETLGIERVDSSFAPRLFDALKMAVRDGRTDAYYEDIYTDLIERGLAQARAVDVSDLRWSEVDTLEDLASARALFPRG